MPKLSRAYRNRYYRTHPEFQARQRANSRATIAKNKQYPEFRLVQKLRKDLYRLKESYQARLKHAELLERRLCDLAPLLLKAERKWKKVRARNRPVSPIG